MNQEHLDKAKEVLKELQSSQTSKNGVMKRAAVVAVMLGLVRSTAGMAADGDVDKLAKAMGPENPRIHWLVPWFPWNNWSDWKNWNDWSDWSDWKNWNDWKDWKNWNDWRDWRDWRDY